MSSSHFWSPEWSYVSWETPTSSLTSSPSRVVDLLENDYRALACELINLQFSWKTASEICSFLAEKVGIVSWANPDSFSGDARVYPALTSEEVTKLVDFLSAIPHSSYPCVHSLNQPSSSQPTIQLLDPHAWNLLFGHKNMTYTDQKLHELQKLWKECDTTERKVSFLEHHFGMKINTMWDDLSGSRSSYDQREYSGEVFIIGSLLVGECLDKVYTHSARIDGKSKDFGVRNYKAYHAGMSLCVDPPTS